MSTTKKVMVYNYGLWKVHTYAMLPKLYVPWTWW